MSKSVHRVTIEFRSQTENVAFARTTVAMFASRLNFTLDEIDEIKIATSEAVSNAVVHGYKGGSGPIRLILDIIDGDLVISVEDEGVGMADIDWAIQPTHTTEPEDRMGLGLAFMHEYMHDIQIQSKPNEGTAIRMVKRPLHAAGHSVGDPTQGTSISH